jgi:hypothetical protein
LERYEASARPSDARLVADEMIRLASLPQPNARQMTEQLEQHYRNANLRMVATAELLNDMLPIAQEVDEPLRETIVGVPVVGRSTTVNELTVRLIPDPQRLRMGLEAAGTVHSRTSSSQGPVTLLSRGNGNYLVRKLVMVSPRGLSSLPAVAEVNNSSTLRDVYSDYDGIPLVGSLVRNYARSQHDEMQSQANREARLKMANRALQRVDAEAGQRIAQAEQAVRQGVLTPLDNLKMEMTPIELQTTEQRMTARWRLAGQQQLGAHTARPRAPGDSLASLQIHESAINNVLQQLDLDGRTFTLPELHQQIYGKLNRNQALPDDLPEDVTVTFAERDAIRVRCIDDRMELTLCIDELDQGRRYWHDFEIRTNYRLEPRGSQVELVRDGTIELGGETYKGKPEVALRGIFSKILSREKTVRLVPNAIADHPRLKDLSASQAVIDDGWIAIALGR